MRFSARSGCLTRVWTRLMMGRLHMDRETLTTLLEVSDITSLGFEEIEKLFLEENLPLKLPEGTYQIDPRTGDRILYHASRSFRPYDNSDEQPSPSSDERVCVICRGETTGIVDVADLSEGFTFINKNLFPVLHPMVREKEAGRAGKESTYGFHFLQWTSSFHDRDWHNMPTGDCAIVISRLAALEKKLIQESPRFPPRALNKDAEVGSVLIIKNYGKAVGASLSHGHQQILFSNIAPRRAIDHVVYQDKHDEPLTAYLLRETPSELLIKDYGPAVLVVPTFMRRPYELFLIIKDWNKRFLFELTREELAVVGAGWHDASSLFHQIMPNLGKEVAFNVAAFTGPGAGIYFEFLPYSQPMGGLERMGLYVCQETPERAAGLLRKTMKKRGEELQP